MPDNAQIIECESLPHNVSPTVNLDRKSREQAHDGHDDPQDEDEAHDGQEHERHTMKGLLCMWLIVAAQFLRRLLEDAGDVQGQTRHGA